MRTPISIIERVDLVHSRWQCLDYADAFELAALSNQAVGMTTVEQVDFTQCQYTNYYCATFYCEVNLPVINGVLYKWSAPLFVQSTVVGGGPADIHYVTKLFDKKTKNYIQLTTGIVGNVPASYTSAGGACTKDGYSFLPAFGPVGTDLIDHFHPSSEDRGSELVVQIYSTDPVHIIEVTNGSFIELLLATATVYIQPLVTEAGGMPLFDVSLRSRLVEASILAADAIPYDYIEDQMAYRRT